MASKSGSLGPEIVPAILAPSITEYNRQLERIRGFAHRISLDFSDGRFAPTRTINLVQAYWPDDLKADFHLMFQNPIQQTPTLISLNPNLVVIHAEARGDLLAMIDDLKAVGIKTGLALLQSTGPEGVKELIRAVDHALIFSGSLGRYGGKYDPALLSKIAAIRIIKPDIEIGWDGGVSAENLRELARAGVDVVNVGSYIAQARFPKKAYDRLIKIAQHARRR